MQLFFLFNLHKQIYIFFYFFENQLIQLLKFYKGIFKTKCASVLLSKSISKFFLLRELVKCF